MKAALALTLLAGVIATPINVAERLFPESRALKQTSSYVTIHDSCNVTQRRMLEQAFNETWAVAEYAQKYVKANGPNDPIFKMYFGDKPQAYASVLGVWEAMLYSDKSGVIFRCDNIDGNCRFPGWRGHWRGSNATSETVICDASYTDRKFNSQMCLYGYQLTKTAPSYYWSVDLIHRLFHVPQISNAAVDHYADNLAESLELAERNSTYSPFDSDALQYFAAHVYINEVVKGGDACLGDFSGLTHSHGSTSSSAVAASSTSKAASSSTAAAAAATTSASRSVSSAAAATTSSAAGKDCHTHADGTIHCV